MFMFILNNNIYFLRTRAGVILADKTFQPAIMLVGIRRVAHGGIKTPPFFQYGAFMAEGIKTGGSMIFPHT